MDEITTKVLLSTQGFLERLIQSDTLTPHQLTEAHMAATAIGYQLAQATYDDTLLAQLRRDEHALSNELRVLLGKSVHASVTRRAQRWSEGIGAELTAVMQGGQSETGGSKLDPTAEAKVAQRLRDFLVSYHEHADPTIGGGASNAYQGGRGDRREQDSENGAIYITAAPLQHYLRTRFAEHRDTTVLDVKRLMGGFSKETYIVRFEAGGNEQTIVIRKDGFGLPTGSSVVSEFAVLREVYGTGVPVPQPLWLESDSVYFGTAFMAVGFVSGEPAHLVLPTDPALRLKWAKNLAGTLATLHRSTVRKDSDVRAVLRGDIADLQQRVEERERHPHPGIAFGLAWLVDHLGDLAGRPACRVHGDAGYHNMLMCDDQLVALLDWEFSHDSDPVEDLIYIKPFIDQIEAWPQFLEIYEAESGFRFDAKAARFFDVWKSARNMVACMGSLNSLLLPGVKDVPLSVAGTIYIPKFEIEMLNSIIRGGQANV